MLRPAFAVSARKAPTKLDRQPRPRYTTGLVMKIKWTHLTSLLVLLFSLASCQLPSEAEIATADSISPEYAAYVEADPQLSVMQKAARQKNVDSWRVRVGLPALPERASQTEIKRQMQAAQPQPQASVDVPKSGGAGAPGQAGPGMPLTLARWH